MDFLYFEYEKYCEMCDLLEFVPLTFDEWFSFVPLMFDEWLSEEGDDDAE